MSSEIILLIILIILNATNIYFGAYFKSKGTNFAKSQDITDLTKKVELVKEEFTQKSATLKSKLDLLTNLQINLKNDERIAVINFHKALANWINLCTESSPSLVDDQDDQEIQMKIREYDLAYAKVKDAQAVLEIHNEDDEMFELIIILIKGVLTNLSLHPYQYLFGLRKNNLDIESLDTTSDEYHDKYEQFLKERRDLHINYGNSMISGLEEIFEDKRNYTNHLRKYLKELSLA